MISEEKLLEYIRQGKISREIAVIEGYSGTTIQNWINKIDSQKVDDAKKDNLRREEQEILSLMEQGNTKREIAQKLHKSPTTIYNIIKRIDEEKIKQAKQKGKEYKTYHKGKDEHISIKPTTKYEEINQKLGQETLGEKDIISYREYIEKNLDSIELKEVVLMLNIYIKKGQASKAVDFINFVIKSNNNSNFNIEKLQSIKTQTEKAQNTQKQRKVQRARKLLEKNISVATVVYYTELKEREVIKIKQEIETQKGVEI